MNPTSLMGVAVTAAGLLATLWAHRLRHRPLLLVAKPSASTGFLVVALSSGALDSPYGMWILAGLALSFIGDVLLMFSGRVWFLAGLVVFLLGHVTYIGAFLVAGISVGWALVAGIGAILGASIVLRWLLPHVEDRMRPPVLAYVAVISLMLCLAFGTLGSGNSLLIVAGAVLFYVSDVFVARDRFVAPGFVNQVIGLPLYYAGQTLLAFSVVV